MADEKNHKPKITVGEKDAAPEAAEVTQDDVTPTPGTAGGRSVGDALRDSIGRFSSWVRRSFPGQERAFWGAVIGLVAAIVFLAVGPWPLLVIAVFVFVGVAAGQALDGDPKIVNTLRHLFNRNGQ